MHNRQLRQKPMPKSWLRHRRDLSPHFKSGVPVKDPAGGFDSHALPPGDIPWNLSGDPSPVDRPNRTRAELRLDLACPDPHPFHAVYVAASDETLQAGSR